MIRLIWCILMHGTYHVPQQEERGWQYTRCLQCDIAWPLWKGRKPTLRNKPNEGETP